MRFHGNEYDIEEITRGTFREADGTGRLVGDQITAVEYRKGQSHDCDAECLSKDHQFRHEFDLDKMLPLIMFDSDGRTEF